MTILFCEARCGLAYHNLPLQGSEMAYIENTPVCLRDEKAHWAVLFESKPTLESNSTVVWSIYLHEAAFRR
jgi:hypothetical protein